MKDTVNLIDFFDQFPDEKTCFEHLAKARWGNNPVCPHCEHTKVYSLKNRPVYKCAGCRKQFSARIGTIFEDSPIALRKWFLVIFLATSLKKGISSVQVSKYAKITQKSAWFMLQRIRHAINEGSFTSPMTKVVELDESYVGGKGGNNKRERGAENKTAIFGMAERKGQIKCKPVENVKSATLLPIVRKNVQIGATIMTDEFKSYKPLPKHGYKHEFVQHGRKEYVRGDVHTNTVEEFWKIIKTGIDAIYIQVSRKHLARYCDEYTYRYNTREMTDFERFNDWFSHCTKRLTYASLTA